MVFSEIRWIAILFYVHNFIGHDSYLAIVSFQSSLTRRVSLASLLFQNYSSFQKLMLYPLSIWQFQTLSLPPHLLFFQPWRVPIYIVNVEVSIIAEHALLRSKIRFYLTPDRSFNFLLESQPTVFFFFLLFYIYYIIFFYKNQLFYAALDYVRSGLLRLYSATDPRRPN